MSLATFSKIHGQTPQEEPHSDFHNISGMQSQRNIESSHLNSNNDVVNTKQYGDTGIVSFKPVQVMEHKSKPTDNDLSFGGSRMLDDKNSHNGSIIYRTSENKQTQEDFRLYDSNNMNKSIEDD